MPAMERTVCGPSWRALPGPGAGEMLVVIAVEVVVRDRRDDPRSAQQLIGKSGPISVLISRIGQVGFAAGESRKLTGAELRPDGLVRLERETGWTVLDP